MPPLADLLARRLAPALWFIPAALALFALGPASADYEQYLRVAVSAAAIGVILREGGAEGAVTGWIVAFAALLVLFDPYRSIAGGELGWTCAKIEAAALFLAHWYVRGRDRASGSPNPR